MKALAKKWLGVSSWTPRIVDEGEKAADLEVRFRGEFVVNWNESTSGHRGNKRSSRSAAELYLKEFRDSWLQTRSQTKQQAVVDLVAGGKPNLKPFDKFLDKADSSWTTTCTSCAGEGRKKCQSCLGSGRCQCYTCSGSGGRTCPKCGGTKKYDEPSVNGRVWVTCRSCDLYGKVACSTCRGSGKIHCSACTGGEQSCVSCKGLGGFEHTLSCSITLSVSGSIRVLEEDREFRDFVKQVCASSISSSSANQKFDLTRNLRWSEEYSVSGDDKGQPVVTYRLSLPLVFIDVQDPLQINESHQLVYFGETLSPISLGCILDSSIEKSLKQNSQTGEFSDFHWFTLPACEEIHLNELDPKSVADPELLTAVSRSTRQKILESYESLARHVSETSSEVPLSILALKTLKFAVIGYLFLLSFGVGILYLSTMADSPTAINWDAFGFGLLAQGISGFTEPRYWEYYLATDLRYLGVTLIFSLIVLAILRRLLAGPKKWSVFKVVGLAILSWVIISVGGLGIFEVLIQR